MIRFEEDQGTSGVGVGRSLGGWLGASVGGGGGGFVGWITGGEVACVG